MEVQLENITDFHENDVLCGKGNAVNRHAGNIQLRALVSELKNEYVATPRKQKQLFSKMIVKKIRSMNPPGRFLMKDGTTGLWKDIGDEGPKGAWSKTRQVLRERAPEIEKQLKAGEIKVTTNFLAEMAPEEIEAMTNHVVRRNRKKGVKKDVKAESAPKEVPIIEPIPHNVPQSNEKIYVMNMENKVPLNNANNPDCTPDPAISSVPDAMLQPEPIIMSNAHMNSLVPLNKSYNPNNSPDPAISSVPNECQPPQPVTRSNVHSKSLIPLNKSYNPKNSLVTSSVSNSMQPPEPVTRTNLHRNSLYLSEIDEDFVAELRECVKADDIDFGDEKSEEDEGFLSELDEDDDEPHTTGLAPSYDAGASFLPNDLSTSFMPNMKESIMQSPALDQSVKRPSVTSSGQNTNSSGQNTNCTSLSLSAVFGMSVQSSQYTMTSSRSKMSLCSMGMSSLMQKSIMSASSLGSFQSMSITGTENKGKSPSIAGNADDRKCNASCIPSKIGFAKDAVKASPILAGNTTSPPGRMSSNSTSFASSDASHYFRQSQHPRGGPNTVSITSSDLLSRHSSITSGGISRDNSGRSIRSENSSLAGYPYVNSSDTKEESLQSLGHQPNTVGYAAFMTPPTESFGESFMRGTESFPHNSQSFHHEQGFMSAAMEKNGASFAANCITSNVSDMQGQDQDGYPHNSQSLHHGEGFMPVFPTPGVNRVSLRSSVVGQGHVAFGSNGQSFQPEQSIVPNANDGAATPSGLNRVSIGNQGQVNESTQAYQGKAKRRQSYSRTGLIALPTFNEDGEDDEVMAEALDCFVEG